MGGRGTEPRSQNASMAWVSTLYVGSHRMIAAACALAALKLEIWTAQNARPLMFGQNEVDSALFCDLALAAASYVL